MNAETYIHMQADNPVILRDFSILYRICWKSHKKSCKIPNSVIFCNMVGFRWGGGTNCVWAGGGGGLRKWENGTPKHNIDRVTKG